MLALKSIGIALGILLATSSAPQSYSQQPSAPPAAPSPQPMRIRTGTDMAHPIKIVQPVYPADVKITGTVVLHAVIERDGSVMLLETVSGNPILAAAAIDAVKQWRYQPILLNNQPVQFDTTINVVFKLDKGGNLKPQPTAAQPIQRITRLTEADQKRLQEQRAIVERFVVDEDSRRKYQTAAGKLGTIRAILQGNTFKPNQTYELQCLGIVLGDALVQELKMEWVMVEDEDGRDPAVRLPGTRIILFPLTMISKRVERSEKVDVFDLFNGITAQVDAETGHVR